jgi:hypothetical protein
MKKNFLPLALLFFPIAVFAATPTASPSGVKKDTQIKIDTLKERLATKVAELKKTSPKALYGSVTQTSISTLTVDTAQKAVKIELYDDIGVYQILKGKRTKLAVDDVAKNDIVTIFGEYDETLDIVTASYIFIEASSEPKRIHGFITSIDKKTNMFVLKGVDGTNYTIDVESATKTQEWTGDGGVVKSGFSKLVVGNFVSIWGTEDEKIPDQYEAIRILLIKSDTQVVNPTPLVLQKASPSATPKNTAKPQPTKIQPTQEP